MKWHLESMDTTKGTREVKCDVVYAECRSGRGRPKENANPTSCYGRASQYLALLLGVIS